MFEVTVTGTSLQELAANVSALAVQLGAAAPAVEAQPDATPAAPKKAPARKANGAAPPETAPDATVAAEKPRLLDFNTEVAPKVISVVESHGKDVVSGVLAKFNVAKASEMEPAQWPELLVALDAAVEARDV